MAIVEHKTLHTLLDTSFRCYPNSVACIYDDGAGPVIHRRYQDVQIVADEIAGYMERELLSGQVAGLILDRHVDMPGILLGCLRASVCFHNLDEDTPRGRLNFLIKKLSITHFICVAPSHKALVQRLSEFSPVVHPVPKLEHFSHIRLTLPPGSPWKRLDDIAYVITTSGTTGEPKVVRVPHSCIVPNITHIRYMYGLTPADRVFQTSPLTFDPSIVEIFTTLSSGAALVLAPRDVIGRPDRFAELLHRQRVSVIQMTPSLARTLGPARLRPLLSRRSPLRVLALGGESCPSPGTLRQWTGPGWPGRIYSLYGITEVSSWATCCDVTSHRDDDEMPLGEPLACTELLISGTDRHSEHQAATGELLIGGVLRKCYLDDEQAALGGAVFRPSGDLVRRTDAGEYIYLGRLDDQIKRHGKRVNLRQMEKVANLCRAISSASAVHHRDGDKLALFITRQLDDTTTSEKVVYDVKDDRGVVEEVRATLRHHLPSYMLPDRIIELDKVPVTKHGKADKQALLGMLEKANTDYVTPSLCQHDVVSVVGALWQEYTRGAGCECENANFIRAGGDSFQAVRFVAKLEEQLRHPFPLLLDTLLNKTYADVIDHVSVQSSGNITTTHSQSAGGLRHQVIGHSDVNDKESTTRLADNHAASTDTTTTTTNVDTWDSQVISFHRCSKSYVHGANGPRDLTRSVRVPSTPIIQDDGVSERDDLVRRDHNVKVTVEMSWSYDTGKCVDASPMVAISHETGQRRVYIGSHSHRFSAVDLDTGRAVWETQLQDRVEASTALSRCARYVIVGCYAGLVYVLSAHTGTPVWTFTTRGHVKSSPCVDQSSGLVYIGSHDNHIYCLDIQKRVLVWKYITRGSCFSSPAVCTEPHAVYVASLSGEVAALQPASGDVIWSDVLPKPVFSSPCVTPEGVAWGCADGTLYYFSHRGHKIWSYKTGGPIFSSPCVWSHPGRTTCVLVGSHDNHLYCLRGDGALLWKRPADSPVYSSPSVTMVTTQYPAASHDVDGKCFDRDYDIITDRNGDVDSGRDSEATMFRSRSTTPVCATNDVTSDSEVNVPHPPGKDSLGGDGGGDVTVQDRDSDVRNPNTIVSSAHAEHSVPAAVPMVTCSDIDYPCTDDTSGPITKRLKCEDDRPTCSVYRTMTTCGALDGSLTRTGGAAGDSPTRTSGAPGDSPTRTSGAPVGSPTRTGGAPGDSPTRTSGAPVGSPTRTGGAPGGSPTRTGGAPGDSPTRTSGAPVGSPTRTGGAPGGSPTRTGGAPGGCPSEGTALVVWCTTRGTLHVTRLDGGSHVTSASLPGEVFSSPVVADDRLVVGCRDDRVYCYQLHASPTSSH